MQDTIKSHFKQSKSHAKNLVLITLISFIDSPLYQKQVKSNQIIVQ